MGKTSYKIPKKIHYCWFGGKELPESAINCIESWKKYCPDYEIIQWDETNVDLNCSQFVKEAYESKKWAFVSDAFRYKVIYDHGGIYFDTDVEVVRPLDELLKLDAFMGFEGTEYVASGLGFGAAKGSKIMKEIEEIYNNISFADNINSIEKISTPILVTSFLEKKGLIKNGELQKVQELTIFPEDYFSPKNPLTRLLNITENTYSIHHYDASWVNSEEKKYIANLESKAQEIMKKQPKKVSIIIPVYNGSNYVNRAIDSALNQTYKNIEVIVVNDGSIDEGKTDNICKSYGNRIRYFKKENGGVASALNFGIEKMRGEYFSWLSHDDEYHPEKIEKQVELAEQLNPDTIVVCNWSIIDEHDKIIGEKYIYEGLEKNPRAFLAFDRNTWLNFCSLLVPKHIFKEYGNFNVTLRTTQDYDLLFRISAHVKFKILNEHLLYSRAHAEQGSLSIKSALNDSDIIHYNIIDSLSHKEIIKYFNNDITGLYNVYDSFFNNGYKRAPAIILKHILKYYEDKKEWSMIYKEVSDKILNIEDQKINDKNIIISKYRDKKTKPRLLFFSAAWFVGGVERVLSVIFKDLAKDYDIILITPHTNQMGLELPNSITHIKLSETYFTYNYDFSLFAFSLAFNVDIAIGCMNLFEKVLNFYQLTAGTKLKTIASNHEHYFFPYTSEYLSERVQHRLDAYKNINASIWLTNYSTKVYNLYNDNGYKIANPNTFTVQDNSIEKKDEKIVLVVGRFYDFVKRVDRTLECFSILLKSVPDAKLVLVGKYDLNVSIVENKNVSINDLIAKFEIPKDRFKFVGEVKNVCDYYKKASVLILTSNSEGFPMVLNEAGSYGLPVVCNEIPGIDDIIINNENGFIVPQDDLKGMAKHISQLLNDNELRVKMGNKAKELTSRFTSEKICNQWRILIKEVLESNDNKSLKKKLESKLHSEIIDNEKFSKQLANELHTIFIYMNNINNRLKNPIINNTNTITVNQTRIIRYYNVLIKSLKENGIKETTIKTLRKIKNKLKL